MSGPSDTDDKSIGMADADFRRPVEGISSHGLFVLAEAGTITDWPPPARRLYGYDPETVLGEHVSVLLADENEQKGDPPAEFLGDTREGPMTIEHWHERADGSVFWGTLTLSPLRKGRFQGYAAVCQDTTERKEYERMLERQNDRLKEFTDILAHDLRNPLSIIDQRLTLYEEIGSEEHLQSIEETTDRMARLVDDLLRVARQGGVVKDPEPTDIGSVIDTAWEGIASASNAVLQYEAVSSVSADTDRLCELFENLFRNSVEHGSTDRVPEAAGDTDENTSVTVRVVTSVSAHIQVS